MNLIQLINQFEKKCIHLGELQTAAQTIRFTVTLESGNTLQAEINETIKEIDRLKLQLISNKNS